MFFPIVALIAPCTKEIVNKTKKKSTFLFLIRLFEHPRGASVEFLLVGQEGRLYKDLTKLRVDFKHFYIDSAQ